MRSKPKLVVLAVAALAIAIPVGGVTTADAVPPKKANCKKKKNSKKKKCHPVVKQGRMTGQGTIDSAYGRSHHVFRNSICNRDKFPDLKVMWEGNRFDLTEYSTPLTCIDTAFDEGQPRAGFDTIVGQGTGVLNGEEGASARFRFTDAGEPGRDDRATITITDADGNVVFELVDERILVGGNHQAHRK
jgi:hypothetical protein